jgi:hypothetical protein
MTEQSALVNTIVEAIAEAVIRKLDLTGIDRRLAAINEELDSIEEKISDHVRDAMVNALTEGMILDHVRDILSSASLSIDI